MNSQLQFVNAWMLYFLWLVPVIAWWWHATALQTERRLSSFISPEMQKKLRPASSRARQMWQTGLVTAGLFLLMMAAARPQWGIKEERIFQRGRDLVIALDVSRSMLANDVHPNRLLRAKADLMDLIKELRGDRAALLAFRKRAITLCPLTTDYAYLRQALDAISIDSAPAGETDIGDAIIKSMDTLKRDERAHKAIIIISDGEDLSERALAAAQEAAKRKIPIFTVGLGSSSGSRIPEKEKSQSFIKYRNEDVVTKLNDKTMHAIAEATGGAYIPVGTASMTSTTLGTIYRDHLSKLSALDIEETLQRRHVERYQWFLLPALLLFLAAAFLSRGRLATSTLTAQALSTPAGPSSALKDLNPPSKPLKNLVSFLIACLVLSPHLKAQTADLEKVSGIASNISTNAQVKINVPPGREGARVAQKYYLMGKYAEAAEAYLEAARGTSDKAEQDFQYNAAVSLFNAKKYKEAADILKDLLQRAKTGQAGYAMGLGSSLFRAAEMPKDGDPAKAMERAELLKAAGEAFKESARSQPEDKQSRKNLAVVLDGLPAAQEQGKIAELMAKYAQTPAEQIADEMLAAQRRIVAGIPAAFTNDSPSQIQTLENLAMEEKNNADLWIALKGKLLESMAQQQNNDPKVQQQLAAFEQLVETTRANMKSSAAALRDIDTEGYNSAVISENNIYQLWKSIAAYQGILQEDIRRQTNVIDMVKAEKPQDQAATVIAKMDQDEAMKLTDIFVKRFSEAVPEDGEKPPPPAPVPDDKSGKPEEAGVPEEKELITAETRRKILDLAGQAATAQKSALALIEKNSIADSRPEQKKAFDLLKEIEKLLPKDKSQNQQEQKKDQQQQQDQKEQQQENKQQDQQQQPQQEEQQKEQQAEQKEEKNKKDELSPEQLKKLLEKAAQREREHEEKKRERNRSIQLSPIDRDW